MTPEAKARQFIDQKLEQAGWVIQDMKQLNLGAGFGIAVREYPTDTGPADYVLFVNRQAIGVIEAKKDSAGENLTVTEEQTQRYATANLKWRTDNTPLRFLFEATGQIIRFTDNADPAPRSREIFHFFKPETLATWLSQPDTLRRRLAEQMPALPELNLRLCQISAVTCLEKSLAQCKPRALVHMATGAGKTFTAITSVYRLLKFGGAKRVLFLVDTRKGVVQTFLNRLQSISLAPIKVKRDKQITLWNKETTEFQYLFIKDIDALRNLVGEQEPARFFRDLESTYVSELIEEVRIRVRLKKNDGSVTFRELSEGEQQLLTVLGLLRFTAEEESLFLLDEPDTHLNPRWCVDYLNYLKSFVGQGREGQDNSHIVLTTHNPLAIAELVKEQVQILYREAASTTVRAENPAVDPKGMGFAGIVTSDMFGLGTSLDKATNTDLLALHQLSTQQTPLSDAEQTKLVEIRTRLKGLDFNFGSRDRFEREYLRARFDLASDETIAGPVISPENKQRALNALVHSLISSLQKGQS